MARLRSILPFLLASVPALAGASGGSGSGGTINVPEPATLALLAAGVGGLAIVRNRRK